MKFRNVAFAAFGALACAALTVPVAGADPDPAPAPAPPSDCNASTLAKTVSSVTASLSDYFAAHPDANQALIDITRQPAFVAVGQFDGYFNDHPQEADELRAIQQPLADYKNRCGMEVSPTDALTVLAEV
ncbi:hemophore-related protein [Mycobacterium sp. OAS707]|uniref:heme-binding protein n=1 Tax=Mycobacterium sp. OAS707 TaxID=2663822 RepID=UPI00178963A1|nr:hemophore-related protein [Mycobacterium sp. OAS707]